MKRRGLLAGAAMLAVMAVAAGASPATARGASVVVFAAASLKTALDAIAVQWHRDTGNAAIIAYAASSALAQQIENGAPAELFISADLKWMDYLQQHNLIEPQTRINLLGNRLVLVAPKDSPLGSGKTTVTIGPGFPLAKLLGNGHLVMAEPNSVPAGIYGKAALTRLGVWPSVAGRVAAAENVRAALLLVARGEAPLGIVYQTDAAVEPGVRIVATFPPDSHPPIIYPMALTIAARPPAAAFAAYLRGPAARALFEAQGFAMLDGAR